VQPKEISEILHDEFTALKRFSCKMKTRDAKLQQFNQRYKSIFVKLNIRDVVQVADCYEHGVPWVWGDGASKRT